MMIVMSPAAGDGGALLGAAQWLEGLVHGQAATTLAVLAVAATGLSMLSGHISVRRGLAVILGCFLLFGASAIARGLVSSATNISGGEATASAPLASLPAPTFNPPPSPAPVAVYDPYAGASVSR